jgi:dolichol-phosphate mannosyltransferase
MVGFVGLIVHFAFLTMLFRWMGVSFGVAQTSSTLAAMTGNFFLNNLITYRDRSLHGVYMLAGLLTFCVACSFGAWVNVSFAETLLHSGMPWYVAGLGGLILSAVWNFSISTLFTWRMPQSRRIQSSEPVSETVPSEINSL